MGEPLVAVLALERLLPRVDPLVLLQVMLELESLAAVATFEFTQVRAVLVVGHVALQLVEGGELLGAHGARDVGVLRVVGAHVPLEGGEGGEVAAAVAGDVGGRLQVAVQVGDRVGDREAGVGRAVSFLHHVDVLLSFQGCADQLGAQLRGIGPLCEVQHAQAGKVCVQGCC